MQLIQCMLYVFQAYTIAGVTSSLHNVTVNFDCY